MNSPHFASSALDAVSSIQSNSRVFVQSVAAAPQELLKALVSRHNELQNVELVHLHTEGFADYALPEYANSFRANCLFIGSNTRKAVQSGNADFTPVFLSEVPLLFRSGILPLDYALIQVSPPDAHGYCSLGVSIDISIAAIEVAKVVIAQINPKMPRTHGDGFIHVSELDIAFLCDTTLVEVAPSEPDEVEKTIGAYCAELIEDGSTLQMGIGAIPNAVLTALHSHKRLGVHTEMFSDGLIPLIESGVVTNEEKVIEPGKVVTGFVMGTKQLYDYIDDNPLIAMKDISYVNDTSIIRQNPKVIAINSAIEVDITGQVCADSIGTKMYSGVGGQMDFIRGASLSNGGKPIIALPSQTSKGQSRITTQLHPGAGVVTTRSHVHYIVTEFGVAYLYGKSLRQRAKELISIAHPNHREELERYVRDTWKY